MSGSFFGSYFRRIDREEREQHARRLANGTSMESENQESSDAGALEQPIVQPSSDASAQHQAPPEAPPEAREAHAGPPPEPMSQIDPEPEPEHEPQADTSVAEASPAASSESSKPEREEPRRARHEESPLDGLMRDKIVVALLQEDVISVPQALLALQRQKKRTDTALWRLIAEMKDVDSEVVFSHAAQLQGFETAHITAARPSDELIEAVRGLFAPHVGKQMQEMGLLPFDFVMDAQQKRHTLVFASNDPGSPDIQAFIEGLGAEVELRFAPASLIADRLRRTQHAATDSAEERESEEARLRKEAAARELEQRTAEARRLAKEHQADEPVSHDDEPVHVDDQTPGLTSDDLRKLLGTEAQPEEEVLVDEGLDGNTPHTFNGDGFSEDHPPEDEHTTDLEPPRIQEDGAAGDAPELQLTDWTGGKQNGNGKDGDRKEPPADDKAPQEPVNIDAIKSKDRVVAMLLKKSIITPAQVEHAQRRQKKERIKDALWRTIASESGADRDAIFAEAARVYAFPIAQIQAGQPDAEFARSVVDTFSEDKRDELFRLKVLPYECDLEHQTGAIKLVFITHDPTRPEVNKLMQQLRLERFELRFAPESVVEQGIADAFPKRNKYLERINEDGMAFDLGTSYEEKAGLIDEDALEAEISRSALINLFEATLVEAVRQGASDVHIYPNANRKVEIHFRVDGRLNHWHTEEKVHPEALLAVIKDNATNVDRFERDAAQDGFIQRWIDEALIRFRVSVLPIANASAEIRSESIVIRVLDDRKVITDLSKLGLLENAQERFTQAISQPHGMVILTGPTGSGKSTTLVAALQQVVTPEVNVLTVEDPVEYIIPGVRQIKLNHKLGLEAALRSILRHDPDIVMVGEMRDRDTAELAIKLANTGHLTFSTLHTNDAPAAVSRLYKMGVEPFLIAYAINLVVAQRLIRSLCPTCKQVDDDPDPVMLEKLGFTPEEIENTTFYVPGHDENCKSCHGTGYKGRRAICEALYFSRTIRHLIVEANNMIDEEALREQARSEGMLTLSDSAREIVKMGETSVREMIRVVTTES